MLAYSWQLQSARVHGGLPRPSFAAKREGRNICGTNRDSSTEAGEQFRLAPGSIRESDFNRRRRSSAPWSNLKLLVSTQKMSYTAQNLKTPHNELS